MVSLCQHCQNFLVFEDEAECDYDQFVKVKAEEAMIYVPQMFECPFYSLHEKFKDK